MSNTNTKQVVAAFVDAINAHDLDALAHLMTEDHVFIDSLGNNIVGAATMLDGWRHYFIMFPDYRIDVDSILTETSVAMLSGSAHGVLQKDGMPVVDGNWTVFAAWRAVVADSQVAFWQVYADNKPVYDLLEQD